jgi:ABC-type bacteriocin/lantibiotic exporter with double-glycine peptidase domain
MLGGYFLAFYAAFTGLVAATTGIMATLTSALGAVPLYESGKPILESLPEVDETKGDPGVLTGDIELHGVKFRYRDGEPLVLQGISLRIERNQFVALVGPSGSGKSTLIRLLLGLDRPESGTLLYDGRDLLGLDVQAVRRQLGTVLQTGRLVPGEILMNIVGAAASCTLEDAWEAARMVGLAEDIERMPMGMYTHVGEGVSTFSGGQRQRLLIARALVHRPRILLLDEATSALDDVTQAIVSESLGKLKVTRVVIAHRLSTIRGADQVHFIAEGLVKESGTYDELMAKKGEFYRLAERQLL